MGLFDALGISSTGLTAQRLRMDVTAENLANAQSVGYKRKDVDFHDALAAAAGSGESPGSVGFAAQDDSSAPVRADGNSVDADKENSELAQNALEYDALARVASARIDILKTAMGVAQ